MSQNSKRLEKASSIKIKQLTIKTLPKYSICFWCLKYEFIVFKDTATRILQFIVGIFSAFMPICNYCDLIVLIFDIICQKICPKKMIYRKSHIWNLFGLYELYGCVSLNFLLEKMIYGKSYICNLFDLHEWQECVSLMFFWNYRVSIYIDNFKICKKYLWESGAS